MAGTRIVRERKLTVECELDEEAKRNGEITSKGLIVLEVQDTSAKEIKLAPSEARRIGEGLLDAADEVLQFRPKADRARV